MAVELQAVSLPMITVARRATNKRVGGVFVSAQGSIQT